MLTYDHLIDTITTWAQGEENVRAAVIIGSRARTDHPADEWSDLDVLLFARDSEAYIKSAEWAAGIAPLWLTLVERTSDGSSWERRVLYEGGLDVDFALNPADWLDYIAAKGPDPAMADIIRRGVRVLVDKDHEFAKILSFPIPNKPLFVQPAEPEFLNAVHDFWYHTLWSAKHLRRGELWWAKAGCDWRLKMSLQQMLEWHAHAINGEAHDTWMRGRFLEEWADPRAVTQLWGVFAHYNPQDVARALQATMDLFRWLSEETAQNWGYTYPAAGARATEKLTRQVLDEMRL
jgi:aminoglycoside 6-adenylyltransferase